MSEMRFSEIYCDKPLQTKTSYYLNGAIISVQKMKSHEKYEKRSLNMEYNRICVLDTETTDRY